MFAFAFFTASSAAVPPTNATHPNTADLTCSIKAAVEESPGYYVMTINGTAKHYDAGACTFSTSTGPFTGNVTTLSDRDAHCTHASWAGCKSYSMYANTCTCVCDVEDSPGAGCKVAWVAHALVADTATDVRCSCS
jgi:hypothetical protein|eukprot:7379323-Prymnesium_polylepis.2